MTTLVEGAGRSAFWGDAVTAPIVQSATFRHDFGKSGKEWRPSPWFYSRYNNPSVADVESTMALLEGAQASLGFSSGMGALAASIFPFARPGQQVVSMEEMYGGTQSLLNHQVPAAGIQVRIVAGFDSGVLADAVTEETRVVLTEIPSNPFSRVLDLRDLAVRLVRRWGRSRPLLVTDATFASPMNLRPLQDGADVSAHSATKYLNGHSDLIAGVLSGSRATMDAAQAWRRSVGASLDPHAAFLLRRGLKTLDVRLRRSEANARLLAKDLEGHRGVTNVWSLALPSHPDHRLGRRLLDGPGAIVTIRLRHDRAGPTRRFIQRLHHFVPAPSLGGVESLVSLPIETSHASLSAKDRKRQGVSPGLVRLAVGIEDGEELVADVRQALRGL